MDTIELKIPAGEDWQELIIAELEDLGFDTYLQEETCLKAYAPASRWDDAARDYLHGWLRERGLMAEVEEQLIESQNWNRRWEESLQPIPVPPFLIKPSWASVDPDQEDLIVLEIDPKMSFGTGYHQSTRIALRFVPRAVNAGDRVLDAGTGTGILAIAALRYGASSALGFDIDPWASTNALENAERNSVADAFDVREGGFEVVTEAEFDVIFANIQRNVLIEMMPIFAEKLVPGGHLVLAGLLHSDRDAVLEAAQRQGFRNLDEAGEAEWWGCALTFDPQH